MFLSAKKFFYGIALITIAAVAFWGCSQPTSNSSGDIAWTAEADGGDAAASTKIDFTFARAVSGLTAGDIIVLSESGAVTTGELTGNGAEWSLGITVETAGEVSVKINREGIDAAERLVAVHTAPVAGWSAQADGTDGVTDSSHITFTFDKTIAGLTADDITVTENTGRVIKGELDGNGVSWTLGITVETAGDVSVSITKDGIITAAKHVAVYKAGEFTALTWSAQADGGGEVVTSTYIGFTFSGAVTDLTPEHITITGDTGSVTKGTLTLDGTEWKLGITVGSAGDVLVGINKDGIETTERKVAVHKLGEMANYSWVAEANGKADTTETTAIVFTFSGAIAELDAVTIALTDDTGSVTKGAFTGNGTTWSLGVTVNTAGNIKVKISSGGIENTERTVAVYKAPAPKDITYDIAADGGESTTSTKIDFTFDAAVEGLTAEQITIANGTGTAAKGALAGSGENWSLAITVATAGSVKVAISKAGIEASEKTVAVHKAAAPVDDDNIVYDIAADGGALTTSTKINFTFDKAVAGLTVEQITVTNDTGSVTKGALTGNETSWALAITVAAAGKVKVKINKTGIEAAEKTVAVHKVTPPPDTTYTAAADGAADVTTSTKITLTFNAAVTGLTAGDISVTTGTGSATKGNLTGSGTSYSLGITPNTAGNVKVKINKAGIEAAEKNVAVYKALPPPDITYTAAADGEAGTTNSTAIVFAFGSAVEGLTAEHITVTDDTGKVTKGALTGGGTTWSLVIAVAEAGKVKVKIARAGIEAAEKNVTVHKAPAVNNDITYSVSTDGGATASSTKIDFTFAADVEGLAAGDITLTNSTGNVAKGAISGSGTGWSLEITVNTAGEITVAINKAGIEAGEKPLTVQKFVPAAYTLSADGDAETTSTKINFVFGTAVAGLTAGDISVVTGTGSVAKGTLTGGGKNWSLDITVAKPGNVQVKILNRPDIETGEKNVAVYKAPVTYSTAADGADNAVTSTKINFSFDEPVAGLTLGDVSLVSDTGSAVKTNLTGSGTDWSLGISVAAAGKAKVKILNRTDIEAVEKEVTVHKAPVGYSATADGESATTTSTKINLVFDEAVSGLSAEDITLTDSTGSAVKTGLTGNGPAWSLGISVAAEGKVKLRINKTGIASAEKDVAVYRLPDLTEDISFYEGSYSSLTQFDEGAWTGAETASEAWTLTAIEQNWVYFAVYKTEDQRIEVAGAEAEVALVTKTESGSVAGAVTTGDKSLAASDELTVFTVDTRNLVFEGGDRVFALKVSEDGKRPKTVSVRVKNNANTSGAAIFLVTRPDGKETLTRKDTGTETYNPTFGDAYNQKVTANGVLANPAPFDGLFWALVWVDHNTGTEQEWLIRVEAAQTEMSKMRLYCQTDATNYASNVTIRLRGMGNTERIVKWNGVTKYAGSGSLNNSVDVDGLLSLSGNSRDGDTPGITFQLEKNITLRGMSLAEMGGTYKMVCLVVVYSKSSLVMQAGSKLTGQEGNAGTSTSVIRVSTSTDPASVYPAKIEAGAKISGNLLTNGGQASGTNGGRVINVNPTSTTTITSPKVFISKDAIITDNGHEGADAVVFKSTGEYGYFISTEADNILPPAAELPK